MRLATLLFSFAICWQTAVANNDQFGAPIEIKLEQPTVVIEIENRLGQPVVLSRIEQDRIIRVAKSSGDEIYLSYRVPSGIYVVNNERYEIGVAVPAIAELLKDKKLRVRIKNPPRSEGDYVWIPSGPAIFGDTLGVGAEDERYVHIKSLRGYWLGATEVTNEDYVHFLKNQETFNDEWIDLESRKCLIWEDESGGFATDSPDHPVVMVSLAGAQAYVDWLSERTGRTHRLPTEFEWEKAARGPRSLVYSYGNVFRLEMANQESGLLKPVKTFQPNGFGLYDMTGNVFEWMSNRSDPRKMDSTMNHALRGGSFVLDGMYLRNSFRMRQSPSVMTDDIGFRVLREATREELQ